MGTSSHRMHPRAMFLEYLASRYTSRDAGVLQSSMLGYEDMMFLISNDCLYLQEIVSLLIPVQPGKSSASQENFTLTFFYTWGNDTEKIDLPFTAILLLFNQKACARCSWLRNRSALPLLCCRSTLSFPFG